MNKAVKIAGAGIGVVILAVAAFVGFKVSTAKLEFKDTPYPKLASSDDPAVIARGEYLAHNVAHCSTCHSQTDGPLDLSTWKLDRSAPLAGGYVMEAGPFGTFVAANLTPDETTGIGRYSDEELARAIKHGVGANGQFLPLMRFAVGPMADEDIVAIMSFLRSREPVKRDLAGDEFGILAKLLADQFSPRPEGSMTRVPAGPEPSLERGKYLAEGPALCKGCHTPLDPMAGFAFAGPAYSGGDAEPDPTEDGFVIAAPNLTPYEKAGRIGVWDEDQFVARMTGGRAYAGSKMPWEAYAEMSDGDLRSIYRYLRSLEPIETDAAPSRRPG